MSNPKLKRLLARPLQYGANEAADSVDPGNPRYIRITDIDDEGRLRSDTFKSLTVNEAKDYLLSEGDLLLARSGATVGKSYLHTGYVGAACFAGYLIRATPNQELICPRFLAYFALSSGYWQSIAAEQIQATIPNFSAEKFADLRVFLPALAEQEQIANFLDEQTAQIDALIAGKKRLLELLAEERLSVTESVLTGPKDDGELKLGFFVDLLPGFAFPSDAFSSDPDDIPLLRGVNVAPGTLRWDDTVFWPRDHDQTLERFKLREGDVVFGMDRPWISGGTRAAMVDSASAGSFLLQRVCRLRGGSRFHQRFLYYALTSDAFRQSIEVELTGVSVPHISPEQILRFKVPAITPDEQAKRCAVADDRLERVDVLESHTVDMLDALAEYRTSLISAAVTGQLDISTFQAKAA